MYQIQTLGGETMPEGSQSVEPVRNVGPAFSNPASVRTYADAAIAEHKWYKYQILEQSQAGEFLIPLRAFMLDRYTIIDGRLRLAYELTRRVTVFATPRADGKFILTDGDGCEMEGGIGYDTAELALQHARIAWPKDSMFEGRGVRNGWRIFWIES